MPMYANITYCSKMYKFLSKFIPSEFYAMTFFLTYLEPGIFIINVFYRMEAGFQITLLINTGKNHQSV